MLRRPAVPSGQYYDAKVGARYNNGLGYIDYSGYRVRPNGSAKCLVQQVDGSGVVYSSSEFATNTTPSGLGEYFELHSNGFYTWATSCGGILVESDAPWETAFDTVLVRSCTSNDSIALSSTTAVVLQRQYVRSPSIGNGNDYYSWTNPVVTAVSANACGYFPSGPTSYRYAHNAGC